MSWERDYYVCMYEHVYVCMYVYVWHCSPTNSNLCCIKRFDTYNSGGKVNMNRLYSIIHVH